MQSDLHGKLIYGFNVSVDGYIADAQGNIDWSDPSEELHQYWNDFERETALSFYGRRLYELMSAYWPTADKTPDATPLIVDFAHIWRDMPKVVFSRTLESVDWNSRLERGDPVEVVTKLKAETDGRLEVAGATLAAPIVQAGLVDEYRLVVAPTAVGGGTPYSPHTAVMDLASTGGEPHLPGRHGPAALRDQTRLIEQAQPGDVRMHYEVHDSSGTPLLLYRAHHSHHGRRYRRHASARSAERLAAASVVPGHVRAPALRSGSRPPKGSTGRRRGSLHRTLAHAHVACESLWHASDFNAAVQG